MNLNEEILEKGFIEELPDYRVDIFEAIQQLKKEKNAVILAHYYQEPDIQDVADFIGDSLQLSQEAEKTDADIIVFAGVHFMAETAKILNPNKKVIIPDLKAGCSLSDSCTPDAFRLFINENPGSVVISYINCSAEIKALSDVICTSSNARKIVESIPPHQKIIFAPDKNLGSYISKVTGREMILWNGACMVHEIFSLEKLKHLKNTYPEAEIIAHPECETPILELADFVGSTTALLNYAVRSDKKEFIVLTEAGIIHQMIKQAPDKTFIPAPPDNSCACNECPHMKRNTLEKIYTCLKYEMPEIQIPENIRSKAYISLKRMLDISS
jgi:quinolinate synthase